MYELYLQTTMLKGVCSVYSDKVVFHFSIHSCHDTIVTTMNHMFLLYLLRYCYIQTFYLYGHSYMSQLYVYIVRVLQ
jgi:hypothetical protein